MGTQEQQFFLRKERNSSVVQGQEITSQADQNPHLKKKKKKDKTREEGCPGEGMTSVSILNGKDTEADKDGSDPVK